MPCCALVLSSLPLSESSSKRLLPLGPARPLGPAGAGAGGSFSSVKVTMPRRALARALERGKKQSMLRASGRRCRVTDVPVWRQVRRGIARRAPGGRLPQPRAADFVALGALVGRGLSSECRARIACKECQAVPQSHMVPPQMPGTEPGTWMGEPPLFVFVG